MKQTPEDSLWRIHGESIRGDQHARIGLPNQDAFGWWPESGRGQHTVVAVSDGHGSSKSFRSDIGAALAVKSGKQVLQQLLDSVLDLPSLANLKRVAEERLPKEITLEWRKCVAAHLEQYPFTDEELTQLALKAEPGAEQTIRDNPYHAYGATLLCALLTEHFVLFLQIGDGDILCVDSFGQTSRPFPKDVRLLANETTSLCLPDAWRDFEVRLMPLVEEQRVLSMLLFCTDGYANSFRSEADFLKIGPDYLHMLRTMGSSAVERELAGFLEEASHKGSGDDITLCIVKRHEEADLDAFQEEVLRHHIESDRRMAAMQNGLSELADAIRQKADHTELVGLEQRWDRATEEWQRDLYHEIGEQTAPLRLALQRQAEMLRRLVWGLAVLFAGLVIAFSALILLLSRAQLPRAEAIPIQIHTATRLPTTVEVRATAAPMAGATPESPADTVQTITHEIAQPLSNTVIIPIEIPTAAHAATAGERAGSAPAISITQTYSAPAAP